MADRKRAMETHKTMNQSDMTKSKDDKNCNPITTRTEINVDDYEFDPEWLKPIDANILLANNKQFMSNRYNRDPEKEDEVFFEEDEYGDNFQENFDYDNVQEVEANEEFENEEIETRHDEEAQKELRIYSPNQINSSKYPSSVQNQNDKLSYNKANLKLNPVISNEIYIKEEINVEDCDIDPELLAPMNSSAVQNKAPEPNVDDFELEPNLIKGKKSSKVLTTHTCAFCGKIFPNLTSKKLHERSQTCVKPFECKICGKFFKEKTKFKIHEKKHTTDRSYPCSMCEKIFLTDAMLKRHEKKHSEPTGIVEKRSACKFCNFVPATEYMLKTHELRHQKSQNFPCDYCPLMFLAMSKLKKHIMDLHIQSESSDIHRKPDEEMGQVTGLPEAEVNGEDIHYEEAYYENEVEYGNEDNYGNEDDYENDGNFVEIKEEHDD